MNQFSNLYIGCILIYKDPDTGEQFTTRLMGADQDEELVYMYLAYVDDNGGIDTPMNGYTSPYGFKYGLKLEAGSPDYYDPIGKVEESKALFKEYMSYFGKDDE